MTCLISAVEVNPIGRRRTRVFCVCVHRFDIVVVVVVVVVDVVVVVLLGGMRW